MSYIVTYRLLSLALNASRGRVSRGTNSQTPLVVFSSSILLENIGRPNPSTLELTAISARIYRDLD